MHPRSLWGAGDVCLRCQWRLLSQRGNTCSIQTRHGLSSAKVLKTSQRALHAAAIRQQLASTSTTSPQTFQPALLPRPAGLPIREHLEQWQHQYGGPTEEVLSAFENYPGHNDIQNGLSKLSSGFKADEDANASEWDGGLDDEGEELITIGLFLKPGDVVELSQAGREPVLAVFVQQLNNDSQFFSVNGRWTHSALARVAFAIPGCIDPALLQPLLPYLPTTPSMANPKGEVHVPREFAASILTTLERMTDEAEQIYRTNAPVLDTAYAVLADTARTRMMTLTQIAKTLLARNDPTWVPSAAALLAVRKALNHNEFRFRSDIRSHRLTNVFAIRPKSDVEVVETVHEWIREYREYLASSIGHSQDSARIRSKGAGYIIDFLEKARRLIARSREYRDPNLGGVGPSNTRLLAQDESSGLQVTWGEPFTSTDKQIINLLQAWVLTGQFKAMAGLHAACASLILATECYKSDIYKATGTPDQSLGNMKPATGLLFLQEIGVLSPHENRAIFDEQLMLPTVRLSRNLELLNTKAELTRKNPDFRDSMADLRRDWGSTTVFCIDDAGALEIDDGISVERVNGSENEFWLHVHVANPTAFFDKTHTLSGLAAHMTETVYTPERSFPMLPSWATQGYFSLDRNRPVITFSSRIDDTGQVLETRIQNGIVRNVVSITPAEVATILGDPNMVKSQTRRLVVGGEIVGGKERPLPSISPSQLQDLRDLFTAAQALWERRKAAGGVRFAAGSAVVRVFETTNKPGLTWNSPSLERARLIHGDPIIELTNVIPEGYVASTIGAKNIVEEMMMLAGQTAATWCTERNIPVMFRGTIDPPDRGELSSEELQRLAQSYFAQHGKVSLDLTMRYGKSLGRAIAHSSPLPHKIIGVPGYVKVTSPLRRFSDMIAHWQIEAAIRYEARSGKKFDATNTSISPHSVLPFSQRQMQESIVTLSPRERIISTTKRDSTQFWSAQAFLRALLYKEAALPEVFQYWVRIVQDGPNVAWRGTIGDLPEYGLKASMDATADVKEGDEWEVTLDKVDVYNRSIFVKPVRRLSRVEDAS